MAKLRAHGSEIGTLEFLTSSKRYMSDGVILKNSGFGWKRYGKVKDGFTPESAFAHAKERSAKFDKERPAYVAFRKMLHDLAPLSKRWKLRAAIDTLGDDIDGIWSEVADGYSDNISADVDEIRDLVRAYKVAMIEHDEISKGYGGKGPRFPAKGEAHAD